MQLLRDWFRENKPKDEMHWKGAFEFQIERMLDDIPYALAHPGQTQRMIVDNTWVISTHTSKSILLPVIEIRLGIVTLVIRSNFYDWKVSVETSKDTKLDWLGLFDPNEEINAVYCEGFPRERVHGSYNNNRQQFTVSISDFNRLYIFLHLIARNFLGRKSEWEK